MLFNVLQESLSSASQPLCSSAPSKYYPPNRIQEFKIAYALMPSAGWQEASEHYSTKWLFPHMADLFSVDDHKPYRSWNAIECLLPHIYQLWVKYYVWMNCSVWLMSMVDSAKKSRLKQTVDSLETARKGKECSHGTSCYIKGRYKFMTINCLQSPRLFKNKKRKNSLLFFTSSLTRL